MGESRKPRRSRSLGSSAARSTASSSSSTTSLARKKEGTSAKPSAENATKPGELTETASDDVVVVHSRTEDGEGMNVVRKRGDELSLGVVRPLEEGKPIVGDVVTLEPRAEHPALFDVKTEVALSKTEPAKAEPRRITAGPSRATNPSYRKGWDSIWGGRRRRRKPN